ncbi:MAG TPA: type 1 glutamine amidotransferase [Roseovarius sp.]|nr:type 1 glutamine amidotransferase [Roseovarius sp.]
MKIGILQTGHAPDVVLDELGDYDAMFARLLDGHGFDFQTWNVVDNDFPGAVDAADGWLVTGSKHGAYENHPWIAPLEDFIRAVYGDGRPMIGVCFGHQIIAQALGGKVVKFPGGWSVGRTEYTIGDETLPLNAWHQDQVVDLPEGAQVVGQSDFCENAALLYDTRIWTIQPHPEFPARVIEHLIAHRGRGVVPDDQLDAAQQRLPDSTANQAIADHMAAFFKRET